MSDETLQRELHRLLADLDQVRERETLARRDRVIAERTLWHRHGVLVERLVLPAMRMVMFELERRGHLGRLARRGERVVRLEVQVAAKKSVQATIEAELLLAGEPRLRVAVVHEFRVLQSLEEPVETLSEKTLAPLLLRSLQRVTALAS